jgi:hypothetical protein
MSETTITSTLGGAVFWAGPSGAITPRELNARIVKTHYIEG